MANSDSETDVPREIANEFRDSLEDSRESVEREIARLDSDGGNQEAINGLFRALHNIKGNAKMCMLDRLSEYGHHIENVVSDVREGRLPYIPELGEVVLLAMDEYLAFADQVSNGIALSSNRVAEIENLLQTVTGATPKNLPQRVRAVIAYFTGKLPQAALAANTARAPVSAATTKSDDLAFFRDLAARLYERLPHALGRIERTLPLLMKLNDAAPEYVDAAQLEAALYIHDIGLAFLPDRLLLTDAKYTDDEWSIIKRHPAIGAAMLGRMPGWEDAAMIVAQHHAWSDGLDGYPRVTPPDTVHAGAQMLALVDSYEAMTCPRPDRQYRRSVLRAVMEINNLTGRQFSATLTPIFIAIVRELVTGKSG